MLILQNPKAESLHNCAVFPGNTWQTCKKIPAHNDLPGLGTSLSSGTPASRRCLLSQVRGWLCLLATAVHALRNEAASEILLHLEALKPVSQLHGCWQKTRNPWVRDKTLLFPAWQSLWLSPLPSKFPRGHAQRPRWVPHMYPELMEVNYVRMGNTQTCPMLSEKTLVTLPGCWLGKPSWKQKSQYLPCTSYRTWERPVKRVCLFSTSLK